MRRHLRTPIAAVGAGGLRHGTQIRRRESGVADEVVPLLDVLAVMRARNQRGDLGKTRLTMVG